MVGRTEVILVWKREDWIGVGGGIDLKSPSNTKIVVYKEDGDHQLLPESSVNRTRNKS